MNNGVNKKEKAITGIMKTLITLVFSGTLFFVWITRYNQYIPTPLYRLGNYLLGVVIFVVYFTFTKLYGGFSIGSASLVDIIYSQVISIIFLMGVCYVLFSLLSYRLLNVIPFIVIALAFSVFAALWSFVTNELYYMVHATKKTIVVFNNYDSYLSLKGVRSMEKRYNVVKTVNSQSITLEELFEEMKDLDAVFLCGVPSDYRNEVVKHCIATGKVAYVKPKISDAILRGGKTIQLLNVPVYRCKRSNASISYTVMKRAFDILVALVGIIVTSPVMAVTAIAIFHVCFLRLLCFSFIKDLIFIGENPIIESFKFFFKNKKGKVKTKTVKGSGAHISTSLINGYTPYKATVWFKSY